MSDIHDFVNEIMRKFSAPYSEDTVDEAFCAIEANDSWLKQYNAFVKEDGKGSVNPRIGKLVKEHTGLNAISSHNKPKSKLISFYSKLGQGTGNNNAVAE